MELKIYNTKSKEKEVFEPIKDKKISIYVCGMTVYDFAHLGHARAYTAFDVIIRFFKYLDYDVNYVRNITDIDDKIIKRASEEIKFFPNNPIKACSILTEKYSEFFHEDMDKLNLLKPQIEPKATEHIDEIIELIQGLIDKEYAYVVDGSVYFRISKFQSYGELSKRNIDDMETQSRIDNEKGKEHLMDFVLWKKHLENEPYWDSPFGKGRPGWHIECSAMSMKYLGADFDIHGGGQDLVFPHHENEIAQSKAYSDKGYAKYWIHNGFITVNKEKMSKSLKNFQTVRDLLNCYDPMDLKFYLLSTHYRSPLDFSDSLINSSKEGLEKIRDTLSRTLQVIDQNNMIKRNIPTDEFIRSMCDDFNTPKALGAIFHEINVLNKLLSKQDKDLADIEKSYQSIISMLDILGLKIEIKKIYFIAQDSWKEGCQDLLLLMNNSEYQPTDHDITDLLKARGHAKLNKNFTLADNIRNYLISLKIEIRDSVDGCSWNR